MNAPEGDPPHVSVKAPQAELPACATQLPKPRLSELH
jgi:hypothetical protein